MRRSLMTSIKLIRRGVIGTLLLMLWLNVLPVRGGQFDTQTKLIATDAAANDYFGVSVAVSGGAALVGAMFDDDGGQDSGSAYVLDSTNGAPLGKLTANDAAPMDDFGYSV